MQKTVLHIVIFILMGSYANAQNKLRASDTPNFHINSLHQTSFKKSITPDPNINSHIRIWDGQLMYWPYYPSTAQQVEKRMHKDDQSVPQYIVSEIVTSVINYRKNSKKPSGVPPKF
jgi:hypothetical protein